MSHFLQVKIEGIKRINSRYKDFGPASLFKAILIFDRNIHWGSLLANTEI